MPAGVKNSFAALAMGAPTTHLRGCWFWAVELALGYNGRQFMPGLI